MRRIIKDEYPDTVMTPKQISYWFNLATRSRYVRDQDQIASSRILIQEHEANGYFNILNIRTEITNAVAFTTPFFEKLTGDVRVDEYFIDATYKTNEPGFDLYAVLANVRGAGFPLAYMLVKNQVGKKDAQFQAVR